MTKVRILKTHKGSEHGKIKHFTAGETHDITDESLLAVQLQADPKIKEGPKTLVELVQAEKPSKKAAPIDI